MMISRAALGRTMLGTGLKTIGIVSRAGDFPENYPDLKKQGMIRETKVVGLVFLTSLMIEALFSKFKPAIRNSQVFQFLPQAFAYGFAEWYSRKTTPYTQMLRKALKTPEEDAYNAHLQKLLVEILAQKATRQAGFSGYPQQSKFVHQPSQIRAFY